MTTPLHQIAPESGLFFGGATFTMRFENPLLSADWKRDMGLVRQAITADVFVRPSTSKVVVSGMTSAASYRTIIGRGGGFAKA